MICHMACDLFKAMDSEQPPMSKVDHPNFEEWRTLYWTLFVMDKQRTSVNGLPFDLYFYHSDLPLAPDGGNIYYHYLGGNIHIPLFSAGSA